MPWSQPSRRGAAQSTPCSPILMTRRHPEHALLTNPNDRAPPRGRPARTATPTRDARQQSPWHSDARATRPAAIPMAHPGDTPSSNPHGTAPHAPHARRARPPSSQPAAAFHGTAPNARRARRSLPLRSTKHPLPAHIRKTTDSLRLPRFCNAQRAPAHALCRTGPRNPAILPTSHDSLRLPRGSTVSCLPEHISIRSPTPATRNAGRSASNHAHTARQRAPSMLPACTIPAACHAKRTLALRVQNLPGTQSPRHSAAAHHPARSQHAPSMSQNARFPQPATQNDVQVPKMRTAPHAHTRTLPKRTIPAACHAKRCPARKNVHGATRARSQLARSPQPAT